ncbi:MBOAT family O-acyltransferase [Hugenholtzia roseola]|uniref:MBOAT family O-acyltransferase n=1 Tax=Hugenholtzia roseola TaxID=1002 RepID=UPI0004252200|nr:MBOAT family O-acyltransferase [Hugenholtzia roseola]
MYHFFTLLAGSFEAGFTFPSLDFLLHKENEPLIFTQVLFWLFFAFVLFVYQFVHQKTTIRNLFLLVFSLYFYYLSSGWYFLILLFSTLIDYFIGNKIHQLDDIEENEAQRRLWVTLSVVVNLLVLGYFKYTFFFAGSLKDIIAFFTGENPTWIPKDYLAALGNVLLGQEKFNTDSIFLPVGISFFTFQTISYSIDIFRNRIKPVENILDFAFYVSFFPQLVAGPIVRASEFVAQIYQPYKLSRREYGEAIFLIINGLAKKILISDYISANYVDRVFADPALYSGFENLMAAYGYAIQIYCDFSGYTDIAIGLALLLGFRLPINFNSPYKSLNITDFWRRWHISLSAWLKDYLYISLGGNRKGQFRTYLNLFLTMFLGGLWHGAAWRFMIWGSLHGIALAIHKLWLRFVPIPASIKEGIGYKIITGLITFHFVCYCWLYFRATDVEAVQVMMGQIVGSFQWAAIPTIWAGYYKIYAVILLGLILHLLPSKWKMQAQTIFIELSDLTKALLIVAVLLLLFQFKTAGIQPFIYFQF